MTDTAENTPGPVRGGPPAQPTPTTAVLDAQGLRALAHPVRVRLLGELRKHGAATATLLADRLGVSSGTASYHLRQLGAAGFVEEDTERGNARERWWRSAHEMTQMGRHWELFDEEPAAAMTYLQTIGVLYAQRLHQSIAEYSSLPRQWQSAFYLSDQPFRITPEESVRMIAELNQVLSRYRRDTPGQEAQAPAGAERFTLTTFAAPELGTKPGGPDTGPDRDADDHPEHHYHRAPQDQAPADDSGNTGTSR